MTRRIAKSNDNKPDNNIQCTSALYNALYRAQLPQSFRNQHPSTVLVTKHSVTVINTTNFVISNTQIHKYCIAFNLKTLFKQYLINISLFQKLNSTVASLQVIFF